MWEENTDKILYFVIYFFVVEMLDYLLEGEYLYLFMHKDFFPYRQLW